MDFKEEIVQFMTDKVGGITIVAEGSAEIVYADSYFRKKYGDAVVGMDAEEIFVWNDDCPALEIDGDAVEWEYIDTNTKKYFKFNSGLFQKEGKNYKIHQITDITEYMGLNRDITKYMHRHGRSAGCRPQNLPDGIGRGARAPPLPRALRARHAQGV